MKKVAQKKKRKGTKKRAPSTSKLELANASEGVAAQGKEENKRKISTPAPKRESEGKSQKKPSIFRYVGISGQFLRESKMELKKVKWPTRKELLASTAVVIVLVLVISLFLGLIDFGLIKIIKAIIG